MFRLDCIRPLDFRQKLQDATMGPAIITAALLSTRFIRVKVWGGRMLDGIEVKVLICFLYMLLPTITTVICSAWSCNTYRVYEDSAFPDEDDEATLLGKVHRRQN